MSRWKLTARITDEAEDALNELYGYYGYEPDAQDQIVSDALTSYLAMRKKIDELDAQRGPQGAPFGCAGGPIGDPGPVSGLSLPDDATAAVIRFGDAKVSAYVNQDGTITVVEDGDKQ